MAAPEILVVSFVPLFRAPAGYHLTEHERDGFLERLHAAPAVRGLVWVHAGDGFVPVFAMERGREVAEHLWNGQRGNRQSGFISTSSRHRTTTVSPLIPDVQRSIARYRTSRRLLHGEIIPPDARFRYSSRRSISCRSIAGHRRGHDHVHDACRHPDWSMSASGHAGCAAEPVYLGPFRVNPADQPLNRLGIPTDRLVSFDDLTEANQ